MHREIAEAAFTSWFDNLKPIKQNNNLPAKGTVSGALAILERLKDDYDLDIESHTAKGGSQIKGASGAAVHNILARFGETRPFASEGGRTNRGLRGSIKTLLDALETAKLEELSVVERNAILSGLQGILVDKVREFHSRERLRFEYDPAKSTWQAIHDLLQTARDEGKEGPVSQYLVGAKLQLRFPDLAIGNESYSTADVQLGRHGDFIVNDMVFHVTVAPVPAVYEKCRGNLTSGLRSYLLVPSRVLNSAREMAGQWLPGRVTVQCLESFISQNLEDTYKTPKG